MKLLIRSWKSEVIIVSMSCTLQVPYRLWKKVDIYFFALRNLQKWVAPLCEQLIKNFLFCHEKVDSNVAILIRQVSVSDSCEIKHGKLLWSTYFCIWFLMVLISVVDPWHFDTDPDHTGQDPAPVPALFVSELQDANKNIFFSSTFWRYIYIILPR